MLDQNTPDTTEETADWAKTVQRGDIVLFKFPIRLAGEGDKPKVRPCLVLEVDGDGGERRIVLAYGTSASTPANRGYEIAITHVADLRAAGLNRATRLVGARLLSVSPKHSGFNVGGAGSPVVGRLTGNRLERMQRVRARLHAEHDIAAERRSECGRKPVTVEYRARRKTLKARKAAA
ncbi:hypothetical protein [Pseudooceanicola sp. 200-1SW]|uniref:hypothetical protein n=1 Tax=Pseudooceanicola sp. 200-1SW TaxID=3425949 RepID=UPI003D7FF986